MGTGAATTPLAVQFGGTGSATSAARSDHTHIATLAPVVLDPTWTPYGAGFEDPTLTRDTTGRVTLQGLVRAPTTVTDTTLFILPAGMRPVGRLIFHVPIGTTPVGSMGRIDVLPDGHVLWIGPTSSPNWVSLSGVSFLAAP